MRQIKARSSTINTPPMQILCPTDFSESAARAADVAALLARRRKIPLRLLHCGADPYVTPEMPVLESVDAHAGQALDAEAARLRTGGAEVITELRHGRPAEEITLAAGEQPTDMIVIGSTGRGIGLRWLIGSVASRVAESAPAPTLVVREPKLLVNWLNGSGDLSVLCAVDFTVSADAALAAAKELAQLGPFKVDAAFIQWSEDEFTPYPGDPTLVAEHDENASLADHERDVWERVKDRLGRSDAKVHVRLTGRRLDYEFVRLADELRSGLIVVGTHQRHGLTRLKEPSFSRGALSNAGTNVLCVPVGSFKPEFKMPSFRRVLVATDFSQTGNDALRHAYGLAGRGGVVRLVHVCHAPSAGINPLIGGRTFLASSVEVQKEKDEAEAKLRALVPQELATSGISCDVQALAHHDAAAAICEAADSFGADVICLGSHGHTRAAAAVLGSVAQGVTAHAHRPVLTVPPPRL